MRNILHNIILSFLFLAQCNGEKFTDEGEQGNYLSYYLKIYQPASHQNLMLLVFQDYEDARDYGLLSNSMRCNEKIREAAGYIKLNPGLWSSMTGYSEFAIAEGYRYAKNTYPQYIWVAIANCDETCTSSRTPCQGSLNLEYEIELVNGGSNSHLSEHEQWYIPAMATLLAFQVMLWIYAYRIKQTLQSYNKLHVTVKLLLRAVDLELLSLVMGLVYYGTLSNTGYRTSAYKVVSDVCNAIAKKLIILMLILVAKGWTIVRRKISATGRVKIGVLSTLYVCIYITSKLWAEFVQDPIATNTIYETPPGELLVIGQAYVVAWFLYACWTTLRSREYRKKGFYKKLTVLGGLYLSVPMVLIFLGFQSVSYRDRSQFIDIMDMVSVGIMQLIMMELYNPKGLFRKSFPFHTNTNAITGRTINVSPKKNAISPSGINPKSFSGAGKRVSVSGGARAIALPKAKFYIPTDVDEFLRTQVMLREFSLKAKRMYDWSEAIYEYMNKDGLQTQEEIQAEMDRQLAAVAAGRNPNKEGEEKIDEVEPDAKTKLDNILDDILFGDSSK